VSRPFLALLAVPLVVAACSSDSKSPSAGGSSASGASGVRTIEVTLSDSGCEPRSISAQAGPTTFAVTNDGSAAVTEFEVLQNGRILGEVENVIPGVDRSFSLTLSAGGYTTLCPGGSSFEAGTLEVADAPTGNAADTTARDGAVKTYLTYVKSEADALIVAVGPFADAVRAGDIPGAQKLFASARTHYESIEPIAESFGDLDPAVDAREGDVPEAEWGGFHRIEKALWAENDVSAMGPVADKLVADLKRLRTEIDTIELEPSQMANGAIELLNEVSTSKITGEEDRYSHTDLADFAANLAGSKAAFEALQPLLSGDDVALGDEIEGRFTAVQTTLDKHRGTDPIGNGYALFNTLTTDDTRTLSTVLDTLAEPLSRVAAVVL
jgi:iron uptake system component EfeO